jgi:hypothetical protein
VFGVAGRLGVTGVFGPFGLSGVIGLIGIAALCGHVTFGECATNCWHAVAGG